MGNLADTGVERLVISRGGDPGLAMHGGQVRRLNYSPLEPLEPRGTGDSIFAGVATQLIGGADWTEATNRHRGGAPSASPAAGSARALRSPPETS
jgi:sugar/nucleoside kinase (ribokinase family)